MASEEKVYDELIEISPRGAQTLLSALKIDVYLNLLSKETGINEEELNTLKNTLENISPKEGIKLKKDNKLKIDEFFEASKFKYIEIDQNNAEWMLFILDTDYYKNLLSENIWGNKSSKELDFLKTTLNDFVKKNTSSNTSAIKKEPLKLFASKKIKWALEARFQFTIWRFSLEDNEKMFFILNNASLKALLRKEANITEEELKYFEDTYRENMPSSPEEASKKNLSSFEGKEYVEIACRGTMLNYHKNLMDFVRLTHLHKSYELSMDEVEKTLTLVENKDAILLRKTNVGEEELKWLKKALKKFLEDSNTSNSSHLKPLKLFVNKKMENFLDYAKKMSPHDQNKLSPYTHARFNFGKTSRHAENVSDALEAQLKNRMNAENPTGERFELEPVSSIKFKKG